MVCESTCWMNPLGMVFLISQLVSYWGLNLCWPWWICYITRIVLGSTTIWLCKHHMDQKWVSLNWSDLPREPYLWWLLKDMVWGFLHSPLGPVLSLPSNPIFLWPSQVCYPFSLFILGAVGNYVMPKAIMRYNIIYWLVFFVISALLILHANGNFIGFATPTSLDLMNF